MPSHRASVVQQDLPAGGGGDLQSRFNALSSGKRSATEIRNRCAIPRLSSFNALSSGKRSATRTLSPPTRAGRSRFNALSSGKRSAT